MKIYDRYYHAMFNTAVRIVKDPATAEDIMQESFITAFEKLGNATHVEHDTSVNTLFLEMFLEGRSRGIHKPKNSHNIL